MLNLHNKYFYLTSKHFMGAAIDTAAICPDEAAAYWPSACTKRFCEVGDEWLIKRKHYEERKDKKETKRKKQNREYLRTKKKEEIV